MTIPQLELFERLAFCWKYFENDGLTANNIINYLDKNKGSVLIIGSGQGIVANAIREYGLRPVCLDCSKSMAGFARERFGIETEVVNFLDFSIRDQQFDTMIVNTGVVHKDLLKNNQSEFVEKLAKCLTNDGRLILSYFRINDFDHTVKSLQLDKSSDLLVEIWQCLFNGGTLIQFLKKKYSYLSEIDYLLVKHEDEFLELEYQIKAACMAYMKRENIGPFSSQLQEFLVSTLYYVSYGISRHEEISLFSKFSELGFAISKIDNFPKLVIGVLLKIEHI